MPKHSKAAIARKAHARAAADFPTWLMMAKLGSFDDLPSDAQAWLTGYRARLEQMSEADATAATIQDIYVAYYAEMGGTGEAPAALQGASGADGNVVNLKEARQARVSQTVAPEAARSGRTLSPFLIFAGMVAILAAFKFAFGN
jgi:hypothetical protein